MTIDLILLAFFLIAALIGWRQGFFIILGRLLVLGVSLGLTFLVLTPLSLLLAWLPFLQGWAAALNEKVVRPLLPVAGSLRDAILSLPLPAVLQQILLSQFPAPDNPLSQLWPDLSQRLFRTALSALVFLMVLVAVSLVIRLAMNALTESLDHLPLLGTVNHLGGLAAGLAYALLLLLIALLLAGLVSPYFPGLVNWLQRSAILRTLYSVNFLYTIMSLFFQKNAT